MSDKILKEAFDKVIAIEEDHDEDIMDGIEELTELQDGMFELIERLDSAIRAYIPQKHSYWQAYGLAQLKIIAGSDEYMAGDKSINDLIKELKAEAGGEDDEYDDDPRSRRRGE